MPHLRHGTWAPDGDAGTGPEPEFFGAAARRRISSLDRFKCTPNIPTASGTCISMRIGRTILAFLIALSLATLPIAAAAVQRQEATAANSVVSSAHDCCDHIGMLANQVDHDRMPADDAMNECQAAAGCYAKCFDFYGVALSSATIHPLLAGMDSIFVSHTFSPPTGSPPFRPPRR